MFGKLMKYELKATYKWYLIISGVLSDVYKRQLLR